MTSGLLASPSIRSGLMGGRVMVVKGVSRAGRTKVHFVNNVPDHM